MPLLFFDILDFFEACDFLLCILYFVCRQKMQDNGVQNRIPLDTKEGETISIDLLDQEKRELKI